jgi:hypothetical protein
MLMIKMLSRLVVLMPLLSISLATYTVSSVFTSISANAAPSSSEVASKAQLKPYIARYKLFRSGQEHGTAERELTILNSMYKLRYKSSIKWLIFSDNRTQSSEFKIHDQQVRPITYRMERTGTGPDRSYEVGFDRKNHKLLINKNKRKKHNRDETDDPVVWNDNWLDPISYQQQLFLDLKQGKKSFDYHFINRKGKEREYKFKVIGEELLTLPYGNIKAIKIARVYGEDSDRQTFAWFAPELNYALVRIWKSKSGTEQFDIQLTELVH